MDIRPVQDADAPVLAGLLNEVIARGGTTALEEPSTPEALAEGMLTGPEVTCCFVAQDGERGLGGFQSLLLEAPPLAKVCDRTQRGAG